MNVYLITCRQFGEGVLDYTEICGTALPMQERLSLFKCTHVLVLTAVREVNYYVTGWPCIFCACKFPSIFLKPAARERKFPTVEEQLGM